MSGFLDLYTAELESHLVRRLWYLATGTGRTGEKDRNIERVSHRYILTLVQYNVILRQIAITPKIRL